MAQQATERTSERRPQAPAGAGWAPRALSVLLASLGVFLTLCLLTYRTVDVSWLSSLPPQPLGNLGGQAGVWIGFLGRGGFGWASLLLVVLCGVWARGLWRGTLPETHSLTATLATLGLLVSAGTLLALFGATGAAQTDLGGVTGYLLARSGRYYLGTAGTVLAASCLGLLSWLIVSGQPLRAPRGGVLGAIGAWVAGLVYRRGQAPVAVAAGGGAIGAASAVRREHAPSPADAGEPELAPQEPPQPRVRLRSTVEPKPRTIPTPPQRHAPGGFQLPPLDLLTTPPPLSERQVSDDLQRNARILEETLREFGIEATVVNIDRGPAVTRYELTPAPGVKLTKIMSLSDDLALVMKAASCHVIAPIPGKGTVGVDVPNGSTTIVYLKEILTAHEFAGNPSPVVLPIGKDVSGQAVVVDLRDCPHLLIAGATGSGKTVCLNGVLTGILSHASPEQVRFLMVDPKMVELAMFNGIPHLVAPVMTSAKKAAMALQWAVEEMERRYRLLAAAGVRNLDQYNKRLNGRGAPLPVPGEDGAAPDGDGRPLPYLVIVIDELADLMMIASQDVEHAITRLAQLSRAVGIHIILATQRPSVDVITGVIKANFPARIAFQVASKVDSRTILDMNGADKLLGRSDLLFLRPGTAKPLRAQGAFVTDAEIEQIAAHWKRQQAPQYDDRLLERERRPDGSMTIEKDELYEQAKQLVLDNGQASTSLLQRRLRLGYGRAARILDLMEQEGLVGPPQGSRPRDILVNRDTRGEAG